MNNNTKAKRLQLSKEIGRQRMERRRKEAERAAEKAAQEAEAKAEQDKLTAPPTPAEQAEAAANVRRILREIGAAPAAVITSK